MKVLWKKPRELQSVVLRMGSFHMTLAMLGVIGKRFAGSGWSDLVIESRVLAPGSVNGVVSGKHYNRGLRVHKLVSEALQRLQLQAFGDFCESQLVAIDFQEVLDQVKQLRARLTVMHQGDFKNELCRKCPLKEMSSSLSVCQLFHLYSDYCRNLITPMATFLANLH